MKKLNNKGFSLVELIIVIAIMAILIGVVALAVIPYLGRSRESRDLSTLNTICSALSTGVATAKATTTGTFEYPGSGAPTTNPEAAKVYDEMKKVLGEGSTDLQTDSAAKIMCYYNAQKNSVIVYAQKTTAGSGESGGTTSFVELQYNESGFVGGNPTGTGDDVDKNAPIHKKASADNAKEILAVSN